MLTVCKQSYSSLIRVKLEKGGEGMNLDKLDVTVNVTGIDDATEKLNKYIELLKEAKTLADELASITLDSLVKVDI